MCDRLQDGSQCVERDSHIQKMSRKEEVIVVSETRETEVPCNVQERLKIKRHKKYKHFSPNGQEYPFLQVSEIFYPGLMSQPRL